MIEIDGKLYTVSQVVAEAERQRAEYIGSIFARIFRRGTRRDSAAAHA